MYRSIPASDDGAVRDSGAAPEDDVQMQNLVTSVETELTLTDSTVNHANISNPESKIGILTNRYPKKCKLVSVSFPEDEFMCECDEKWKQTPLSRMLRPFSIRLSRSEYQRKLKKQEDQEFFAYFRLIREDSPMEVD